MIKLKEYRETAKGFSDLLTYGSMLDEYTILQKDGSLLSAYEFVGIDTSSATENELEYLTEMVSQSLQQLSTGFMIHIDAIRTTTKAYPSKEKTFANDIISKMIDDERREYFGGEVCYSTTTVLAITYKPQYPKIIKKDDNTFFDKEFDNFKKNIMYLEDNLSSVLVIQKLGSFKEKIQNRDVEFSELLSYLNFCITGIMQPIRIPPIAMYIDAFLGGVDVTVGVAPTVGIKNIATISIDGLPQVSYPMMFQFFNDVPYEFRMSSRFICLDQFDGEKEINTYLKGWNQQTTSLTDQFMKNANAKLNRNALIMREDAENALESLQLGEVGFGFVSNTIVMMSEDKEKLDTQVREIKATLQSIGCISRIETINAMDAYLSTLPGNSKANIRRPLISTLNLADMMPLAKYYIGSAINPSPFFPPESRPLAVLTTANGSTPFWLNIHVGDLGHTMIFGPTGSGKSTLLALILAQFKCYENAKIYAFDKGMSLFPLCKGVNGEHFEIGGDGNSLSFAPLQNIDESKSEMAWAEDWVADLLELQGMTILPIHRNEIHAAMLKLEANPRHIRSLTDFMNLVQNFEIKEAIQYYTEKGTMGFLLDAQEDKLGISPFIVFEIEELMNMGKKNLIPVLMYIFHRIEKSLNGQPAIISIDEAWNIFDDEAFLKKLREWLKVLRKANCAVVLATQSLSDAKNSGIQDVLIESCPTKILLANPNAPQEDQYILYKGLGLNDREIDIISREAHPKRDYYIRTIQGRRLVQLALGAKTLAFVGSSDKTSINRIKDLIEEYGENEWQKHWVFEKTHQEL